MRIFNEEKTTEISIDNCDLSLGRLVEDTIVICHHEAVAYSPCIQHYEERKYANGGVSMWLVVDKEAVEPQDEWDETEDIYVYKPFTEDERKDYLRMVRQSECFRVVDRGRLWYESLTQEQLEEVKTWYEEWLNVTETLTEPQKPSWLQ